MAPDLSHRCPRRADLAALAAPAGVRGPAGPPIPGAAEPGSASYWFLTSQPQEGIRTDTVKRFNAANQDKQIQYTTFQNDAYKTKIKTAIGAGQAPDDHLRLGRRPCAATRPQEVDDLTS